MRGRGEWGGWKWSKTEKGGRERGARKGRMGGKRLRKGGGRRGQGRG